ncbi:MAG: trigger factor [Eubacteriales bacterium]|nr:trigger factor [Eubacteriales bacterium]
MIKKGLKKTAAMCAVIASIIALTACGSDKVETNTQTTSASEAQQESSEEAADAAAEIEKVQAEIDKINPVMPEELGTIKLGEYKNIAVEVTKTEPVADETVDLYIENYILPAYTEEVDDEVKLGDTANIDYVGKKDGVEFEGGSAEGFPLTIGSGQFIPGFEDGLIGAKKGETLDINLTFPEDYHQADLAGADVVFTVTVNSITRQRELTDELVKEISPDTKTVAEYKESVRKLLQENVDYSAKQELYYNCIAKVIENSEIEVSEEAIEWKTDDLIKNFYEPNIKQAYGLGLAQMLSMSGETLESFRSNIAELSEETVKQLIVMDEIANKENIKVTDADLQDFADENGVELDTLIEQVGKERVEHTVRQNLANKFVADNAKVTYVEPEEAEAEAASEADASEAASEAETEETAEVDAE